MSEIEKKWYVLRAISGKEAKVREYLEADIKNSDLGDYVSQVLIPTEKVYQVRNGKKIVITLKDTLKPNTTYSIDFSDAVQDNNEGNPLPDFGFTFSTGSVIDSKVVSSAWFSSAAAVNGFIPGMMRTASRRLNAQRFLLCFFRFVLIPFPPTFCYLAAVFV